jgi:hypothetical protein
MSKTLVIPDIHHARNLDAVEEAIARERPTTTVFLGDYFDQWDDTAKDAGRTAEWLKSSLKRPDRVHLFGNHDLPYAFPGMYYCPGFTEEKLNAISDHIAPDDWGNLVLTHWEGNFLMSHAGLTDYYAPTDGMPLRGFLSQQEALALECLSGDRHHWIWAIGRQRGGDDPVGGLVWCDVREFRPIPGINQIFGHTPTPGGIFKWEPNSRNWCIDTGTRSSGVRHYALVEQDRVSVRMIDGSPDPEWENQEGMLE